MASGSAAGAAPGNSGCEVPSPSAVMASSLSIGRDPPQVRRASRKPIESPRFRRFGGGWRGTPEVGEHFAGDLGAEPVPRVALDVALVFVAPSEDAQGDRA